MSAVIKSAATGVPPGKSIAAYEDKSPLPSRLASSACILARRTVKSAGITLYGI